MKPVDKREGGGAHNWGRQEDSQKSVVQYTLLLCGGTSFPFLVH